MLLEALIAGCCLLDVHDVNLMIELTFFPRLGGRSGAAAASNSLNTTHLAGN